MKATINVKASSQYARLNGLSFPIKDTFTIRGVRWYGLVGVNPEFPNNQVDFSEKELRNVH